LVADPTGAPGSREGPYTTARFTPDGSRLFALRDEPQAFRWEVNPNAWRQHACSIVGGGLAPEQWEEKVPEQDYIEACPSAAAIPAATPPGTGPQAITALETTITKPKGNIATRRQTVTFEFTANQPGATFECAVDPKRPGHQYHQPFHPCTSPFRVRGIGYHPPRTHVFAVRATVGGVTDATPARVKWYRVG
jgi:hypothetical protein